jgi:hypothetical protein
MKMKIFSILILFMLILSIQGAAGLPINKKTPHQPPTPLADDVPVWSVGDTWTYAVSDFTFDYEESGYKLYFDGSIDDFTWTVVSCAGNTYTIEFTGDLDCVYDIYLSSSSGTFAVTGSMKPSFTQLSGTLVFGKTDLHLQDMNAQMTGITAATLYPLPIPLPLPFKATFTSDLTTPFPLYDFPLSTHKFWTLPEMDIQLNAHVGGILGLFTIPITFITHYSWTP